MEWGEGDSIDWIAWEHSERIQSALRSDECSVCQKYVNII